MTKSYYDTRLHIDICRHFIEYDTIIFTIELIAKLGLSTLYLHLSDDQSMPFSTNKIRQNVDIYETRSQNVSELATQNNR